MEQRSRRRVSEIKSFYDDLTKNGELEEMFPSGSGVWKEDKENFIKYYVETIEMEEEIQEDNLLNLENVHLRDFKTELGLEDEV